MLQFVKDMVKDFNVGPQKTHIAVVAYSNNAKVEFKFNSLRESEITEERYYRLIERMGFQRGFTFIDKALILTNEEIFSTASGMRPGLPQVWKEYCLVTFLTDKRSLEVDFLYSGGLVLPKVLGRSSLLQ